MSVNSSPVRPSPIPDAPDGDRPRRRIAWTLKLAFAVLVLAIGGVAISTLMDRSREVVFSRYKAIKPGMSRAEVRKVVRDTGTIMYTGIGTSELMHIDGKFMIAVTYEPPANRPLSKAGLAGVPDDGWVAKEMLLLEMGRGGHVDDTLVGLGLKSARVVDRFRMP